jgi:protein-tyrosine phosphatase
MEEGGILRRSERGRNSVEPSAGALLVPHPLVHDDPERDHSDQLARGPGAEPRAEPGRAARLETRVMTSGPVQITGYVNFRDLGGHATPNGRVRSGLVYRSDSLAHVDADDVEHLAEERGIRTVVDLRREYEVETSPLVALEAAGLRVVHVGLIDPAVPPLQTTDIVEGTLADRYVSILDTSGAQFVTVLGMIAEPTNHPIVFQCAAGKDRTGLVAAMVLGLLGVDEDVITADYAATAAVVDVLLARLHARMPGREPPGPRIMSAEASTMQAALDWMRAEHGSVEAYARAHGLTDDQVDSLRTALVERSA